MLSKTLLADAPQAGQAPLGPAARDAISFPGGRRHRFPWRPIGLASEAPIWAPWAARLGDLLMCVGFNVRRGFVTVEHKVRGKPSRAIRHAIRPVSTAFCNCQVQSPADVGLECRPDRSPDERSDAQVRRGMHRPASRMLKARAQRPRVTGPRVSAAGAGLQASRAKASLSLSSPRR
jgi:hypothetical protein